MKKPYKSIHHASDPWHTFRSVELPIEVLREKRLNPHSKQIFCIIRQICTHSPDGYCILGKKALSDLFHVCSNTVESCLHQLSHIKWIAYDRAQRGITQIKLGPEWKDEK